MSRMGCQLWKPVIKSLRSSRWREYRRITNGAYLESIWIGHSQEIAASNYDSVMPGDADFIHNKKGLKVVDVEDENTDAAWKEIQMIVALLMIFVFFALEG